MNAFTFRGLQVLFTTTSITVNRGFQLEPVNSINILGFACHYHYANR